MSGDLHEFGHWIIYLSSFSTGCLEVHFFFLFVLELEIISKLICDFFFEKIVECLGLIIWVVSALVTEMMLKHSISNAAVKIVCITMNKRGEAEE